MKQVQKLSLMELKAKKAMCEEQKNIAKSVAALNISIDKVIRAMEEMPAWRDGVDHTVTSSARRIGEWFELLPPSYVGSVKEKVIDCLEDAFSEVLSSLSKELITEVARIKEGGDK